MFTRRLATFLLGIWIGCCLLLDAMALQGQRTAASVVDNPQVDGARVAIAKAGPDTAATLLKHLAGEQVRSTRSGWEVAQALLGGLILILLVFTDQRKPAAIGMTLVMASLVLIQHFLITPDLNYLSRELDFLPESASFSVATQVWSLTQAYGAAEVVKLLIGGALASYFFAMESVVKRGRSRSHSRSKREERLEGVNPL